MLQELTVLLNRSLEAAQYKAVDTTPGIRPPRIYTASDVRGLYEYNSVPGRSPIVITEVLLYGELREDITNALRGFLGDFILGDEIGTRLIHSPPAETQMDKFADGVIQAADNLGPEEVTSLLDRWARGESIRYREHAVLSGVSIDQPLEMADGIYLGSLPKSSDQLLHHLPRYTTLQLGEFSLLSKVKVSVDCLSGPVFFRPDDQTGEVGYQRWRYNNTPSNSHDSLSTLCEVLSLSCNSYITWVVWWPDYWHESGAFCSGAVYGRMSYGNREDLSRGQVLLSPDQLEFASSLLEKRLHLQNLGVGRAIRRWMGSKRSRELTDQFIELRVALETLYPTGGRELGFRIANYGAWHLGDSFGQRKEYREVLSTAYGLASDGVHKGSVEDTSKNRQTLTKAQDLCRDGIIKRLHESEEPKWQDMILGAREAQGTELS